MKKLNVNHSVPMICDIILDDIVKMLKELNAVRYNLILLGNTSGTLVVELSQ